MNHPATEGELVWEFFGRNLEGFFVEVGANDLGAMHAGSQEI